MQQTTTRVYEYTDLGSPVLNGTNGSLIALLKTILVGTAGVAYGGKPSLGWTVVWEDGSSIVFRNNSILGNGAYLKVTDNTSYAQVWAWENMSDIDTGTDPVNIIPLYVYKSGTTNSVARPWFIVGDERTFYMCSNGASTLGSYNNSNNVLAFGDYIRFDGKPGVFISGSRLTTSSSNTIAVLNGFSSSVTDVVSVSRNATGSTTPTYFLLSDAPASGGYVAGMLNNTFPGGVPAGASKLSCNPAVTIWNRVTIEQVSSPRGTILGYLRGFWVPQTAVNKINKTVGYKEKPALANTFSELLVMCAGVDSSLSGWFGVETQRSWDTV